MAIKLFAVDMDGTCLNHRNCISGENMRALAAAAAAGITVAPATGRSLSCLPHQLRAQLAGNPFFRYVISSNGARVTDIKTGETLFQALIPRERALELLRAFSGLRLGLTAHVNGEYLVQGRGLYLMGRAAYRTDARAGICVSNMEQTLRAQAHDVEELQPYFFTASARRRLEALLEREAADCFYAFDRIYVEVFSRDASKGSALCALGRHLGIARKEIACIGDAENDLPMFRSAGLCFAMGNAQPQLRARADRVVASNREDGVAQAVYQYLLR